MMFCGLEFQVLFSALLEDHCSSMDEFISCLVFLISKLNMIASFNDTLHKHCIFWIPVGLMRGAQKYELFYLRWICLLCVCICFVLEAYIYYRFI